MNYTWLAIDVAKTLVLVGLLGLLAHFGDYEPSTPLPHMFLISWAYFAAMRVYDK